MSSPMSTLPSETDLVFIRRSCVHVFFRQDAEEEREDGSDEI